MTTQKYIITVLLLSSLSGYSLIARQKESEPSISSLDTDSLPANNTPLLDKDKTEESDSNNTATEPTQKNAKETENQDVTVLDDSSTTKTSPVDASSEIKGQGEEKNLLPDNTQTITNEKDEAKSEKVDQKINNENTPDDLSIANNILSVDASLPQGTAKNDATDSHDSLAPWEFGNPHELVAFEFEDTDLRTFIDYIAEQFHVTFLTNSLIQPTPKNLTAPTGAKISFRTHAPLAKKEAWSLFLTFLDMAGFTAVPDALPRTYRIVSTDHKSPDSAQKGPLPTYIGVNPDILPSNDTYIRYIYFINNASLDVIKNTLDWMKSPAAPSLLTFPDMRGIVITDKSYNIKSMMQIVQELDTTSMPETLSVIKLKKSDATQVANLYKELTQNNQPGKKGLAARLINARQPQTLNYFDTETRVIAEPRSNILIVLGRENAVHKVEQFIKEHVDHEIDRPYLPIHVYQLKHLQADAVANVLNQVIPFKNDTEAGKIGSVRDGDKYFGNINIHAEKSGNKLIITGSYDDYLKIHDIIEKIDIEQQQVAIQVLLLNVEVSDTKDFGAQIRNKKPGSEGLLGSNVNFQTSGLGGSRSVVENTSGTGATRLLGDLITLASGGATGSSFLTLGSDSFGVWGIFRLLQSHTHTTINSNPFLVTTNNYTAEFSAGEKRRVITGTTAGAGGNVDSFNDVNAALKLSITPRISYEGYVTLDIALEDTQFTNSADSSADRVERKIDTSVIVPDKGVLAFGGLVKDAANEGSSKVPGLGNFPVLGWFFKNKQRNSTKSSLIVLISPEIIPIDDNAIADTFTQTKINHTKEDATIGYEGSPLAKKDPIHRWFFNDHRANSAETIEEFVNKRGEYLDPAYKKETPQGKKVKSGGKKRLSDYL